MFLADGHEMILCWLHFLKRYVQLSKSKYTAEETDISILCTGTVDSSSGSIDFVVLRRSLIISKSVSIAVSSFLPRVVDYYFTVSMQGGVGEPRSEKD